MGSWPAQFALNRISAMSPASTFTNCWDWGSADDPGDGVQAVMPTNIDPTTTSAARVRRNVLMIPPGRDVSQPPRRTGRYMPCSVASVKEMRRAVAIGVVLAAVLAGATGCRAAQTGARCRGSEPGTDGHDVMLCVSGRWKPLMTVAAYVDIQRRSRTPTNLSGGGNTMCVRTDLGWAKCAGANDVGQLGDGTTRSTWLGPPGATQWVVVKDLGDVVNVAQSGRHGCATRTGLETVVCWGANESGQLGDGTTTNRLTPVVVPGLVHAYELGVGGSQSCVLTGPGGVVYCWGAGEGSSPVKVADSLTNLSVGTDSACGVEMLGDVGRVICWGANDRGQLGDGTTAPSLVPVAVSGLTTASFVDVGDGFACTKLFDDTIRCWGTNAHGELGVASPSQSSVPVGAQFADGRRVFPVLASGSTACASASAAGQDFHVYCWGTGYGSPAVEPRLDSDTYLVAFLADGIKFLPRGEPVL